MRWDDRSAAGMYSGEIPGLGRTSTLSYVGHTFFFLDKASRTEVARFTMESGVNFYIIEPTAGEAETLASPLYVAALAEAAFMADYSKRTGTPWLSAYGRGRPVLNMWPADNVGQTHVVSTKHSHHVDAATQLPGDLALQLTVLSHAPQGPRAFVVKNLLSDFECDHIIELGKSVVKPSLVGQLGGFKSKTRSSENGWLSRSASPVLENMYLRFADVLGLDEKQLNAKANAEELQVVRYRGAQEYAPHHDFGDDGLPEQRFLTLLLYIQLPAAGGATSFPKAAGGRGISVVPARGDAILFYNMLPDGNGDDLALHAGMPVLDGEKWVCNLWIWDPVR
ncbi:hypothetical protein M885DRAFT_535286 [Pelagophyceae sp. CCMP2097]|nr:hypothetical protein M885DRAFT_535286 [Pelagophyceae sp. CCMP2097]